MRTISMSGWGLLGGSIGLGIVVAACSSDASTAATSPVVNFENPEFDGGKVSSTFDGSSTTAEDDSGTTVGEDGSVVADAGPPVTTVTVLSGTTPLTTAKVVFQHADGTLIESVATDAKGQATHEAEDGMMVTVVNAAALRLTTFVGVKPNESLVVDEAAPPSNSGSYPVSATFPAAPGGTTKLYTVRAGTCTGTNGATTVTLTASAYSGCVNTADGTVPVIVSNPLGNGGSAPPAWTLLAKNPLNAAGTTTVDFTKVAAGGWTTTFDSLTATIANAGPNSGIQSSLRSLAGGVGFAYLANPTTYTGNTAKFILDNVPRAFDGHQLDMYLQTVTNPDVAITAIAKRFTGTVVSGDGSSFLPQITATLVDPSTPSRPRVTWSSSGPLTGADGGFVRLYGTTVGKIVPTWNFVIPPGATEVKAPVLPADLVSYVPAAPYKSHVVFMESDQVSGYDQFRELAAYRSVSNTISIDGLQNFVTFLPVLPSNGTVRATARAIWNG